MAKQPARPAHFHCPKCDPVLVRGQTLAVCGAVIPEAIVIPRGEPMPPRRKCPDCRQQLPEHNASHRKG